MQPETNFESSPKIILFATRYTDGAISTLGLTLPGLTTKKAKLELIASNTECGPNPAWLTIDVAKSSLYCVDRGINQPNGSLSSYKIESDGHLVQLDKLLTRSGGLASVGYGDDLRGLAVAFK